MRVSRRELLQAGAASWCVGSVGCGRPARPAREGGRIVVTFWYAFGDLVRKVLLELVARFNEGQRRVLVKAVHQGDYFESLAKLRTALAAGVPPSLTHVVLEVLPYLARAGVLQPLERFAGAADLAFAPGLDQGSSFAGAEGEPLVAIPFNRSTPIAYANGRVLAEEGARLPTDWDDLLATARALTRRGPEGTVRWGFELPISWWYWVALLGQAGGTLFDGAGRPVLGGAAGERAIRFWQRLVRDERVMRPPPGRDYVAWQATNESFLQQRVVTMWNSTAYVRYLEDRAGFPVVAGPLPRGERAAVPTGGTMFVVLGSAPDEEKEAAWEFIRFMCEDDQAMDWSTRTGYLPVTRSAVHRLDARGWYESHPNDRVACDQLAAARPWPWSPELFRIERDVVEPRLEDAVRSGRDARAVMDEAREEASRRP
ncbi:MAG: ABC transporter substrate-binding protein [Myxococcales bacterium]|nr:ABC transporter substrate-binding protein [Myxococcales bacterium]